MASSEELPVRFDEIGIVKDDIVEFLRANDMRALLACKHACINTHKWFSKRFNLPNTPSSMSEQCDEHNPELSDSDEETEEMSNVARTIINEIYMKFRIRSERRRIDREGLTAFQGTLSNRTVLHAVLDRRTGYALYTSPKSVREVKIVLGMNGNPENQRKLTIPVNFQKVKDIYEQVNKQEWAPKGAYTLVSGTEELNRYEGLDPVYIEHKIFNEGKGSLTIVEHQWRPKDFTKWWHMKYR